MTLTEKKNLELINESQKLVKGLVDNKLSSSNSDIFGGQNLLMRSENFPDTKYWSIGIAANSDNRYPCNNLLNRTLLTNKFTHDIGGKAPADLNCTYDIRKIKYHDGDLYTLHIDFKETRLKLGGYYWRAPRLTEGKTYTVSFMARGRGNWDIGHEQGGHKLIDDLNENEFKLKQWTFTANNFRTNAFIMYCDPGKNNVDNKFLDITYMYLAEGDQRSLTYRISENDLNSSYIYGIAPHPWNKDNYKHLQLFNKRVARDNSYISIKSEKIKVYPNTDYTFSIQAFNNYALQNCKIFVALYRTETNASLTKLFSNAFGNNEVANRPRSFTFNTEESSVIDIRIINDGKYEKFEENNDAAELWIYKMKLELGTHFTGFSRSLIEFVNK